jgi:hypothetical protein
MTIAIKLLVFGFIIALLGASFPHSIIVYLGLPINGIATFVTGVATFISNISSLGDVFLIHGSTLLMVKAFSLFVFFYIQFKILFPIVKLIVY